MTLTVDYSSLPPSVSVACRLDEDGPSVLKSAQECISAYSHLWEQSNEGIHDRIAEHNGPAVQVL
jgi:hypothetical protein